MNGCADERVLTHLINYNFGVIVGPIGKSARKPTLRPPAVGERLHGIQVLRTRINGWASLNYRFGDPKFTCHLILRHPEQPRGLPAPDGGPAYKAELWFLHQYNPQNPTSCLKRGQFLLLAAPTEELVLHWRRSSIPEVGLISTSQLVRFSELSGFRVFATSRRLETMKQLSKIGIETLALDVTRSDDIRRTKENISTRTGGKLDILINNA
jgi:hypothetical protein